jgi:hypothetical protein
MRRIRHLSFANVVSLIALFVALGGTALASVIISSNSQVGPGTISGHKPPSGKHANIISGSVNGSDVVESSLGIVPNASKLDGLDSSQFGRVATARFELDTPSVSGTNAHDDFLTLPGLGQVNLRCSNGGGGGAIGMADFENTSSGREDVVYSRAYGTTPGYPHYSEVLPTGLQGGIFTAPGSGGGQSVTQVADQTASPQIATVILSGNANTSRCLFFGQVVSG